MVKIVVLSLIKQFPFLNKKFLLRNSKGVVRDDTQPAIPVYVQEILAEE